ncbi:Baculoviral IAP repeat-containing protein 7-A [Araneus ventricosus]|uniref:Baculoviral IAP repeat-containing protein 7-A n=1 Tax=Araneus ventricosus TaxID=182803 RepID=A0A4Y2C7C9_ARAVE|nr:Baculoviral IAP repeat-containing protein 7-A [Araneus ventricosus]
MKEGLSLVERGDLIVINSTIFHLVELTNSKMAAHVALNPFNHQNEMAVLKEISDEVNYNRIEKIHKTPDEYDNPSSYCVERSISDENTRNQELFDIMKYEVNRLNSFTGKWPLCYIKPKDLAQNGFFYLQSEDKVQCAFCGVVIDDWNVGEKPVKKHMMRNPKCIFLLTADAGNVPFTKPKPVAKTVNKCIPNTNTRNTLSHKPKYPQMSDMNNRLLSYRDWPILMLSSRQLAECGLFYTGVEDHVTCFYCGGSLGDWKLNDDPWVEHERFYPDCGFLDLVKTRIKPTPSFAPVNYVSVKSNSASVRLSAVSDIPNEVIRQACEIFPDSLVQKVAIQHFQKTGKHFTSLHGLCDAILQYKAQEQSALTNTMSPSKDSHKSGDVTSNKAPAENANNTKLICKICLDEDINIVLEPCHHQVACEKCAQKVTKCPLCRSVITNRIKVFWG